MGTALAVLWGRRWRLRPMAVVDGALAAAGGGLLAGRATYVAANWAYFHNHRAEALQVWQGGLSAPGALVGALIAVFILCRVRRIDPRPLLDALAPGAAVVASCAWVGCLEAGCAWGLEVWPGQGLLWSLSAELPDLHGLRAPRVAVQALGAGWYGLSLAGILLLGRQGRAFPLWLLLHAAGDFGLSFLRGDLARPALGLAVAQMVDLALALVGLVLLAIPEWRPGSVD